MTQLKELIEKTENVKPLAEKNGVQTVTFAEQRDLATLDAMNGGHMGDIAFNPDGTVARTPARFAAVNPAVFYRNRYKKFKNTIQIVRDYRAITEQSTGSVYLKQIPAYVISRDSDDKLFLSHVISVSDSDFIAEFTNILSNEAMAEILPLIENGVEVVSTDDLPI